MKVHKRKRVLISRHTNYLPPSLLSCIKCLVSLKKNYKIGKEARKKATDTGITRHRIKITITIINRLRILVEKMDHRDDQVGNFSRQIKI